MLCKAVGGQFAFENIDCFPQADGSCMNQGDIV